MAPKLPPKKAHNAKPRGASRPPPKKRGGSPPTKAAKPASNVSKAADGDRIAKYLARAASRYELF